MRVWLLQLHYFPLSHSARRDARLYGRPEACRYSHSIQCSLCVTRTLYKLDTGLTMSPDD